MSTYRKYSNKFYYFLNIIILFYFIIIFLLFYFFILLISAVTCNPCTPMYPTCNLHVNVYMGQNVLPKHFVVDCGVTARVLYLLESVLY